MLIHFLCVKLTKLLSNENFPIYDKNEKNYYCAFIMGHHGNLESIEAMHAFWFHSIIWFIV